MYQPSNVGRTRTVCIALVQDGWKRLSVLSIPSEPFHFHLRCWLQHSYSKHIAGSGQHEQKNILKNYSTGNTHAYNMEDLEKLSSIPMSQSLSDHPLKVEAGARVSPASAYPSAREMELGPWEEGGIWGKRKERKIGERKSALISIETNPVGLKCNPVEEVFLSLWTSCVFMMITLYWALLSHILSFKPFEMLQSYKILIINYKAQKWKLKTREVKWLAQGHRASKW